MKTRIFLIEDINCDIIVDFATRKELLSYLDEYTENCLYNWFDGSDQQFTILYNDGTYDCINEEYDNHKIKKQNIKAICYDNPCTTMIYGHFSINEYGVVTVSEDEQDYISEWNIKEIKEG